MRTRTIQANSLKGLKTVHGSGRYQTLYTDLHETLYALSICACEERCEFRGGNVGQRLVRDIAYYMRTSSEQSNGDLNGDGLNAEGVPVANPR